MKGRRSKESFTRRARAISLLAILPWVAFLAPACRHQVTGLGHASCDTSDFTTFGSDDQEDLFRCIQRGVPINGDVTVGGPPADVP